MMNKNHRLTRHNLAWLFILCLIMTIFMSACKSGKDSSNKDSNVEDASNEASQGTDNSDVTVQPTEAVTQSPETVVTEFTWPEDFSLCDAYTDYFMIGTIYTDAIRSGTNMELTLKHFNAITPENIMKPEYMQPTEGTFKYDNSDTMVKFAQDNGLNVIGHTLAWHQQTGTWLGKNVTRDEAIAQLKSHITNIVEHHKGQMTSWDVVNEAINDGTTLPADGDWTKCLRQTQWLSSIGTDYLALAFTFAREADPDLKLYYNDYNLNNKNKADIVYAMVKDFQSQGIPIDGVGMQGHYNTDTSMGSVEYSLKLFSELGVEISITELDVGVNGAAASGLTEEQEIKQAVVYANLFQLLKEYKDTVTRVTFWGYLDTTSWRSESFPCLFNDDYTPKEAAYAVFNPEMYLEQHQVSTEIEIKKIKASYGTPVIDGEVDESWKDSEVLKVNNQLTAWEGATGTVRLLWDESFIYVLYEVKDSLLNKQSVNAYEQDSIELFVDQNNDKTAFYDIDDGQYRVNYEGDQSFGTIPAIDGFNSSVKVIDGGYLVEVAIPLLETAKEGNIVGFDAQINDSNGSGVRQSVAKFSDLTDNSWSTTENWANLELVK